MVKRVGRWGVPRLTSGVIALQQSAVSVEALRGTVVLRRQPRRRHGGPAARPAGSARTTSGSTHPIEVRRKVQTMNERQRQDARTRAGSATTRGDRCQALAKEHRRDAETAATERDREYHRRSADRLEALAALCHRGALAHLDSADRY